MKDHPVSPAVVSLLSEQAEQSVKRKTRLEKGLEDTFPASDPISATHTATATGVGPADDEPHTTEALGLHPPDDDTYPLVDTALKAVEERRSSSFDGHLDELQAMRRDVASLGHRIGAVARDARQIAWAEADMLERSVTGAFAKSRS